MTCIHPICLSSWVPAVVVLTPLAWSKGHIMHQCFWPLMRVFSLTRYGEFLWPQLQCHVPPMQCTQFTSSAMCHAVYPVYQQMLDHGGVAVYFEMLLSFLFYYVLASVSEMKTPSLTAMQDNEVELGLLQPLLSFTFRQFFESFYDHTQLNFSCWVWLYFI